MKYLLSGTALALCLGFAIAPAHADTSGKRVALSNNYAGNSWRQAMLQSYAAAGKQAIARQDARRRRFLHDRRQGG